MNYSLVAYDDSDSEAEAGKTEDATSSDMNLVNSIQSSVQSHSGKDTISESKIQPVEYMDNSRRNIFQEDVLLQYPQANKNYLVAVNPKKTYSAILKIPNSDCNQSLSPLLKPKRLPGNESFSQKRACSDSDATIQGLRPYIPKRLRQEKNTLLHEAEDHGGSTSCVTKLGTGGDQISIKTSEYIMPYIGSKYRVTEIPKNLVFQMSEHSGPVNAVRWCPVQKWSHMLLSASMDKTVKVWDAVDQGCCLTTYFCHTSAVRAVQWSPCGRGVLSGGFDSMLHFTDIETGLQTFSRKSEFRISTLEFHPLDPNVFICGGFSPEVKAWDIRTCKVIKVYKAAIQQTLDIMFLPEGKEFLTSTDAVSQDSADRTIIAWDFHTAAKISNQIFHERYTCPTLTPHPKESVFVAQTNGNYLALFSSLRPYRINKKKRYEGHKVEGFAVGCEFSPDGMLLATGSSEGKVFFYNYSTARIIRTLSAHSQACVSATFHPVLPSLFATCDWGGEIKIWQ
ncbi:WD repeat-containing protein 25 isoform X1 [Hemicordylus capensis]|uniref:WD repeat-containing protein 25 isoform X1 n=1 Tax=Hemicordylus capensis TaxID=884348 RepID=UPI002302399C|nr:WD repeat-containing protein 25 isoform X1 [Hemicordylus capensis]XP_053131128.1 WD repeat-containing protein 25 isoform X1 [Hemicordylus capensis]XP_053131139.1 WD repeat-containing protein 25 isoform X1 [Hemicordylus capensis]XP_053131148.1 WD repeat-containing protein 25 isoform X1 [Hemicordylus capensis]